MSAPQSNTLITFSNVSRFYGEVLGVNKVNLADPARHHQPGGPQRLRQDHADEPDDRPDPSHAGRDPRARHPPDDPEQLCRLVGYCAQFDAFPKGLTGYQFIYSFLRLFGYSDAENGRAH